MLDDDGNWCILHRDGTLEPFEYIYDAETSGNEGIEFSDENDRDRMRGKAEKAPLATAALISPEQIGQIHAQNIKAKFGGASADFWSADGA